MYAETICWRYFIVLIIPEKYVFIQLIFAKGDDVHLGYAGLRMP